MKALIAMSGGVDSSVAALLTQKAGFECIGCTMKLYENEDAGASEGSTCGSLSDAQAAENIAARLGMPFYVFDLREEFRVNVIDRFACSYLEGRTPNPCIDCNRYMKFGMLGRKAEEFGCDHIVTGHYARIEKGADGSYVLKKAADISKDQSYVLYSLTQQQLAHIMFPLGEFTKTETRNIAEENGFINADKPDSQDICFVPDGDYAKAVEKVTGTETVPGDFLDISGNHIGMHKGIIHYTVGQRRGLGISSSEPYYVCRVCPEDNTVILGRSGDLMSREMNVREVNWISGNAPKESIRCSVKIRYRHKEQAAVVTPDESGNVHVEFNEPQRAITPGQSAVFYDGDIVLGGGVIV